MPRFLKPMTARTPSWPCQQWNTDDSNCRVNVFLTAIVSQVRGAFFHISWRNLSGDCQRLNVKERQCEANHSSHRAEFTKSWKYVSMFPLPQETLWGLKRSSQATQPTIVSFGSSDNRRFSPFPNVVWVFNGGRRRETDCPNWGFPWFSSLVQTSVT